MEHHKATYTGLARVSVTHVVLLLVQWLVQCALGDSQVTHLRKRDFHRSNACLQSAGARKGRMRRPCGPETTLLDADRFWSGEPLETGFSLVHSVTHIVIAGAPSHMANRNSSRGPALPQPLEHDWAWMGSHLGLGLQQTLV